MELKANSEGEGCLIRDEKGKLEQTLARYLVYKRGHIDVAR